MPARAPASIAMLQTVMRPSIDSARIALPANSIAWPVPPAVPILPMIGQHDVLGGARRGRARPRPAPASFFAFFVQQASAWPARARLRRCRCRCASAPKAPCVLVCESPQTTVMPGSVAPCSGPITCTMPWRLSQEREIGLGAELVACCASSVSTCSARDRIGDAAASQSRGRHVVVGRRRRSSRCATACGRRASGLRRPAGSSPRAPGGGRCRAARCRRRRCGRRGRPRACRKASVPFRASNCHRIAACDSWKFMARNRPLFYFPCSSRCAFAC